MYLLGHCAVIHQLSLPFAVLVAVACSEYVLLEEHLGAIVGRDPDGGVAVAAKGIVGVLKSLLAEYPGNARVWDAIWNKRSHLHFESNQRILPLGVTRGCHGANDSIIVSRSEEGVFRGDAVRQN